MDQLVSPSAKEWIKWFTSFSIPALILVGILLFTAGARSGKYIFKCILAPAIGLAGIFVFWLGMGLAEKFPKTPLLENASRATAILILFAALICAILGLIEYSRTSKHSSKRAGGRYAVVTAVICGVSLSALSLSIYSKKMYGQGNFFKVLYQPKRFRFYDLGFQIYQPSGWIQVDGTHLKPSAVVAFTQIKPALSFSLVAQKPGPGTPENIEALVKLAQEQISSANSSSKFTEVSISSDRTTAVFESQEAQTVFSFYYVHRLLITKGFTYHMTTGGPASDPLAVRAGADIMLSKFALLR